MSQYSSPLRAARARQTRLAIIDAALRLFLERGYVESSIRAIAEEAGVSERTVYVAFEDKSSILAAVADHAFYGGSEEGEGETLFLESLKSMPDPYERLRTTIHRGAIGRERGLAAIARMIRTAARNDSRMKAFLDEMIEYRHRATRARVEIILGRELPERDAYEQMIDELEAITSDETYLLLVEERGWPRERYEDYVVDMCVSTVQRYGLDLEL